MTDMTDKTVKTIMAEPAKNNYRGRQNVKARLIESACHLLSQFGPRAVSVRDIARHAGVNHGQVHHYFGNKKNLLAAAIRQLAKNHMARTAKSELDMHDTPPALSLAKDRAYIQAVIRCVIDGELELATLELEENISVPRHIMAEMSKALGQDDISAEIKSTMAITIAIEWSWAILGEYILRTVDTNPKDEEEVRAALAKAARLFLKKPNLLTQ